MRSDFYGTFKGDDNLIFLSGIPQVIFGIDTCRYKHVFAPENLVAIEGDRRERVQSFKHKLHSRLSGYLSPPLSLLGRDCDMLALLPPKAASWLLSKIYDDEEIHMVAEHCREKGVGFAMNRVFAEGAAGGEELARLVVDTIEKTPSEPLRFTYEDNDPVKVKIQKVAESIYGAAAVTYVAAART